MLSAGEVLDTYFLDTRCMLLEIAATMDRLDHAVKAGSDQSRTGDLRLQKIQESLSLLAEKGTTPDRAERLLNLFSDLD